MKTPSSSHARVSWLLLISACLVAACSPEARRDRHLHRAQSYFDNKKYEEAIVEYLNVLKADGTSHIAIRQLGLAYMEVGNLREAYPFLLEAHKQDAGDGAILAKLAALNLAAGKTAEAITLADGVGPQDPAWAEALLIGINARLVAGKLDDALARLQQGEAQCGNMARYQIALGSAWVQKKEWAKAEAAFRRAVEIDPQLAGSHLALGDFLMLRGETATAGESYQKAVDLSPINSEARLKWSEYKLRTGDKAGARLVLEEIARANPEFWPAQLAQAGFAFDEGDYQQCLSLLEPILKKQPQNLRAVLLRNQALASANLAEEAIKSYNELLSRFPDSPLIHQQLGLAFFRDGKSLLAEAELNKALTLDPKFAEATLQLAEVQMRSGRTDDAIENITRLLKDNPNNVQAYKLLGAAYRSRGMLNQAIFAYGKVADLSPKDPSGPLLIGRALRAAGREDEARAAFEKALALDPRLVLALAGLAEMDAEKRQFDAALNRVLKQVETAPNSAELRYLAGRVQRLTGDLAAAEASFRRAIELDPGMPGPYGELTRLYVEMGNVDQALKEAEAGMSARPDSVATRMIAAGLYERTKDYEKARELYEAVLKQHPNLAVAANNLAYLMAEHLGMLDRAFALAQQARAALPQNPYINDTLGWVVFRRGDHKWALSLLAESADQLTESPDVQYHYAMAQYGVGDEKGARLSLAAALKSGQEFAGGKQARLLADVLAIDPAQMAPGDRARLEEAASKEPSNAAANLRLGVMERNAGEPEKARKTFEQVLKIYPLYVPALIHLASLAADRGDLEKARDLARKARELQPGDAETLATLGRVTYEIGDFQMASGLLQDSANQTGKNPETFYYLGLAQLALGKVEDAATSLQKALDLKLPFPGQSEARRIANSLEHLANPGPEVVSNARATLEEKPEDLAALAVIASAERQQKDQDALLRTCEQIIRKYPDFGPALRDVVQICAARRQTDELCMKRARRARELMPQDRTVAAAVGTLAYHRGDFSWAAGLLKEACNTQNPDAVLLYYWGLSAGKAGDKQTARSVLERAIKNESKAQLAPVAEDWLKANP